MLLVKTTLRPSEVHGLGLFADEFIPKGTVIWRFDGRVDHRYDESQLAALPAEEQERLFTFCFQAPGFTSTAEIMPATSIIPNSPIRTTWVSRKASLRAKALQ